MSRILKILFFLGISFFVFLIPIKIVLAEIPADLLKEGKQIYQIQKDYLEKCLTSDWKGIYSHQHPTFKEKVSIEEFIFYDGKVVFNYRDGLRAKVSGGFSLPSLKYIRENSVKKDMLGYPAPRKYQITTNPLVDIKNYSIDSIALTSDRKYARVTASLIGKMTLPPSVVRAIFKIPFKQPFKYFWENIDGKWAITLLKDRRSFSGNSLFYFIPNNFKAWETRKFINISSDELLKGKS